MVKLHLRLFAGKEELGILRLFLPSKKLKNLFGKPRKSKSLNYMFVFRYIRTGCFTINGDPPSGTSFLVKLGHLKRLIYEKFERDEFDFK